MKARIFIIFALLTLLPLSIDFTTAKTTNVDGNITSAVPRNYNSQTVSVDLNGDGIPELENETYTFRGQPKLSVGDFVVVVSHKGLLLHNNTIYKR